MQLLPRLQPVRGVLAEVAGRPKEFPAGWDDQLVEDHVELIYTGQTIVVCPNRVVDV